VFPFVGLAVHRFTLLSGLRGAVLPVAGVRLLLPRGPLTPRFESAMPPSTGPTTAATRFIGLTGRFVDPGQARYRWVPSSCTFLDCLNAFLASAGRRRRKVTSSITRLLPSSVVSVETVACPRGFDRFTCL